MILSLKARETRKTELGDFRPEHRVNSQLLSFMNEHHEIMTEQFRDNFIDHSNIGLAPQAVAELSLHHRERGLDVRPLVVMLQKLFTLELEVMKRFIPNTTPIVASGVRFESDKRLGSDALNSLKIHAGGISLIGGNFGDLKVLRRGVNK